MISSQYLMDMHEVPNLSSAIEKRTSLAEKALAKFFDSIEAE